MFSIDNTYKFESFAELISKSFNARTKETLIEILYEHLPEIFEGKVLIFLPVLNENKKIKLEVPKGMKLNAEVENIVQKIEKYYESDKQQYPAVIDGWFINPVKEESKDIFLFALENKAMEKLNLHEKQKDGILYVVASLFSRVDELEEDINRNIQLEKERLRSQILSSVSHDLKTPLSVIIGSLNILTSMEGKISEKQKKDLIKTSVSEAHRLNYFITNILKMARIESGGIKAKLEWQNVEDVIKHIERRFNSKHPERILAVKKIDEKISFNVDATLFEQIIMNVLDNAVKYSPADIEIELNTQERGCLNFIIRDHGKGVPDDMLDKIFDKYSRLGIGDRQIAGTGLGLAIAKALADLQNIRITAQNHKEGGFIVKISCPEWKE